MFPVIIPARLPRHGLAGRRIQRRAAGTADQRLDLAPHGEIPRGHIHLDGRGAGILERFDEPQRRRLPVDLDATDDLEPIAGIGTAVRIEAIIIAVIIVVDCAVEDVLGAVGRHQHAVGRELLVVVGRRSDRHQQRLAAVDPHIRLLIDHPRDALRVGDRLPLGIDHRRRRAGCDRETCQEGRRDTAHQNRKTTNCTFHRPISLEMVPVAPTMIRILTDYLLPGNQAPYYTPTPTRTPAMPNSGIRGKAELRTGLFINC